MNQRQKPKPKRRKGATVAAVLCFVAAIAIVGTYTFRDYNNTLEEERLALEEEEEKQKEQSEEASGLVIKTEEAPETLPSADTSSTEETSEETPEENAEASETAGNENRAISFSDSSKILWPVEGSILLNYSMDKTIYFSTLDQYKYNPAVVIAAAEGDQVICGAPGVVKSIDVSAETGTTVNVDIGSGYELFYGQLAEVPVKVGDYVEAKTVLGYVSAPTKYYSVEGSNVYFEMRKDGQPINPGDYN